MVASVCSELLIGSMLCSVMKNLEDSLDSSLSLLATHVRVCFLLVHPVVSMQLRT